MLGTSLASISLLSPPRHSVSFTASSSFCMKDVESFISTSRIIQPPPGRPEQMIEAFPEDSAPGFLLRDRDSIYGHDFQRRVAGMQIEEVITAPHSPWQNPYSERLIGSIRRECLDHVIVLSEEHLRRILKRYFLYYQNSRPHQSLDQNSPIPRTVDGLILVEPSPLKNENRYWTNRRRRIGFEFIDTDTSWPNSWRMAFSVPTPESSASPRRVCLNCLREVRFGQHRRALRARSHALGQCRSRSSSSYRRTLA